MDNNLLKYKEELLNTGLFRRVSEGQYVCKTCPFCGDTKSHMYVLIKLNDDTPVLYNCFKCNSHAFHVCVPFGLSFTKDTCLPQARFSKPEAFSPESIV